MTNCESQTNNMHFQSHPASPVTLMQLYGVNDALFRRMNSSFAHSSDDQETMRQFMSAILDEALAISNELDQVIQSIVDGAQIYDSPNQTRGGPDGTFMKQ